MDRNSVIGLLFIGAIIIGFSILNKPSEEEIQKMKHAKDSIAQLQIERDQLNKEQQKKSNESEIQSQNSDSLELQKKVKELGELGKNLIGENEFYTLENDLLILKLSKKGGRPYSVQLKKYQTHDSLPLILFNGDSTIFNFPLTNVIHNTYIHTNEMYFDLVGDDKNIIVDKQEESISLRLVVGEEQYLEYVYSLQPNKYMVDFTVNLKGMNKILGNNLNSLTLIWSIYSPQQEKGKTNENTYTTIFYKHSQDDVESLPMRTKKEITFEDIRTSLKWVAFKDQFFSSVLIADQNFSGAKIESTKLPEEDKYLRKFHTEIGIPLESGNSSVDLSFYFGPNHFKMLKKEYEDLELYRLVTVGKSIIGFINRFVIIEIFNFLERFMSNYGLIILILTLVIKIALLPLTYKSYISQAKMKVLKPQIDEINERIPKDKPMDRQKATMDLYKKVGINPLGGCLPMLLQMPILYAMFRFFPSSIELRQEAFLWAKDLSTYDAILEWSNEIPILSSIYGNHISLFTLLMTLSTLLTINMSSQATSASSAQMPGMKTMMYIMPIMFMFFLNNFSSGLTYYYFLANMITFGQNILFKRFVNEEELLKKLHAKKAKPTKQSGFQARLEKMAKERGYKMPKK